MKIGIYCYLIADILTKLLQKCSLIGPLPNISFLSNLLIDLLTWPTEMQNLLKKYLKTMSKEAVLEDKAETLQNCF